MGSASASRVAVVELARLLAPQPDQDNSRVAECCTMIDRPRARPARQVRDRASGETRRATFEEVANCRAERRNIAGGLGRQEDHGQHGLHASHTDPPQSRKVRSTQTTRPLQDRAGDRGHKQVIVTSRGFCGEGSNHERMPSGALQHREGVTLKYSV